MSGRKLTSTRRERAALAWTEALTRLPDAAVCDEVFAEASAHLTEAELLELTLSTAETASMSASAFHRRSVEVPAGEGFLLGVDEPLTANRRLLFGIAYRMLGSVADAEDIVQETWLRWQRQNAAEIRSPKAWLVSTTTRLCIDQLRSARRTREEYYGVWLPEPIVETRSPSSDERAALADSLATAFMLMLETLSPVERAVFCCMKCLPIVTPRSHRLSARLRPIAARSRAAPASD
ncbi:MAG TPA: sigma factor [Terrimicrobiaceae bacterium]|nr:sigma factor [Terrimicrobiaceae bacterium]